MNEQEQKEITLQVGDVVILEKKYGSEQRRATVVKIIHDRNWCRLLSRGGKFAFSLTRANEFERVSK